MAREIGDRIWADPTHIWGINAFQSSTRPYTCRRAVVTLQPPASFHVSTHVRKHDGRTPSGTILYLQEAKAVSHTTTPSVKAFPNLLIREAVPFNAAHEAQNDPRLRGSFCSSPCVLLGDSVSREFGLEPFIHGFLLVFTGTTYL